MQRKDLSKLSDNVKGLPLMNNMSYANIPFSDSIPRRQLAPFQSPDLQMALSALPIFGGEEDQKEKETTTTTTTEKPASTTTTTDSGGTGTESSQELSPKQISDLLAQTEELNRKVGELTTENQGYKEKETQAERAKLGREEALAKDLEDRDKMIVQLDAALKRQAIVNAINGVDDIKFHSTDFILSKLDPSIAEGMEVDLENSTVTVSGIENELKRIASENEWAVKSRAKADDEKQNQGAPKNRRPSGTPPPAPGGGNGNQARREALIDKHPVLGMGRTKIPR